MAAPKHVYEIYIRTTPERLWRAITDSSDTRRYYYNSEVISDWSVGSPLRYVHDGQTSLECTIQEIEPERKLVHSFSAVYGPHVASEPASRVTWEIKQMGELCRLRLIHDEFAGENHTFHETAEGWPQILSGLKTLVETGEPLHFPMPAEAQA